MSTIPELEKIIFDAQMELAKLRRQHCGPEVKNYTFQSASGPVSLSALFGDKDTLFAIHNMGAGCRYCTLWADGINAFLPHLEAHYAVVLLSKDSPSQQRQMANDRGWRFQLASHQGGAYLTEETVLTGPDKTYSNYPGMVCYIKKDGRIFRKNSVTFGPGDEFCSFWSIISLAGDDSNSITPQFHYWKRPESMEDGGRNLND